MQRTEEEWEQAFGFPVEGPEGTIRGQSAADLETVMAEDPKKVWSVIEGEGDSLYLRPGFHVVNKIGYVIAENARTPRQEASGWWDEVLWFDGAELTLAR